MSARAKARKRALDLLFQADVRGEDARLVLAAEARRAAGEPARQASWLYAREIVDGVIDHQDRIDEEITANSRDWKLERMPAVDRAVLRIGTWELLFNDAVPDAVAINEAIELAKEYSTEEAGGFVNGVLGRIARSPRAGGDEP